jgi:mRNA interferase YafQ
MREIRRTGQFKRDVKRMQKRGKDTGELRDVVERIAAGETLEPHYRDHPLVGGYSGARECHIEPDWLLIYERTETELVLIRTGTHADLFGE